jgi:integrase
MAGKKGHYGSGTIAPLSANSFRIRYRINGVRFAKTVKGSRTEAARELRRLLQAGDDGRHVAPDRVTLRQWIEQWIAAGAPNKRKRKKTARTIERYEQLLKQHVIPTLGDTPLQKLESDDIDRLYQKLAETTMAERTLHHVHVVLGASLRQAVRKKKITASPMEAADVPEVSESDHGIALDEAELGKMVRGFKGSALYSIVAVAAYTGMRLREVMALQWIDISFEQKTLTISRAVEETKKHGRKTKDPKTERGKRTIELGAGLVELLAAERERHLRLVAGIPAGASLDLSLVKLPAGALVFPGGNGTDLTKLRAGRAVSRNFKARVRKLGFPKMRFHDLRGSHETILSPYRVVMRLAAFLARCRMGIVKTNHALAVWPMQRQRIADAVRPFW